ncbi:uncharacterized protein SAMN05421734_10268 [Pelagirhabdus alkalitolerans]|uniref:DUF177 domain-containing protein n=1 Tax=Pelagirhabdus alkalitolerans TaxID=1612202 RepID=A0A1G6H234_9BACI|nr:YceD family protein [Pelagirhabdus alkalitolerans]SDB87456.1 uncharacterized protein SAMN05421734_10268 [Pelagirhabdus alkalitolerans]
MKIPVQKILQTEELPVESEVDLTELESLKNDIRKIGSVLVEGRMSAQDQTITAQLNIKGEMILPCARTLVDVHYSIDRDVIEVFSIDPYYQEEDESEMHPVDGEMIDLKPYIEENVLLEIPFRVYADPETIEEQALSAGEGWEVVSEDDLEEKLDPRFEKLQSLFNDDKNENQ